MPRPTWHENLNELKPIKLFNWQLNLRLLAWRYPKKVPAKAHDFARRADTCLRIDRSGPSGPNNLAVMFHILGWNKESTYCSQLATIVRRAEAVQQLERHKFPTKQWPGEPHIHDHLIAELERGYDPETFTLTKEEPTSDL